MSAIDDNEPEAPRKRGFLERLLEDASTLRHAVPAATPRAVLRVAGVYALAHAAAVLAGFGLQPAPFWIAVYWPASGLLAVALYTTHTRHWPWLLAAAALAEIGTTYLAPTLVDITPSIAGTSYFTACHLVESVAVAWLGKRSFTGVERPDARRMARGIVCMTLGAALSAVLAAPMLAAIDTETVFLDNMMSWFLADLAGLLIVMPIVLALVVPERMGGRRGLAGRTERIAIMVVTLASTSIVFGFWDPGTARTLLQSPVVIVAPFVWAAVRAGPLAVAWLALAAAATPAAIANTGFAFLTFSGQQAANDLVQVQTFFVLLTAGALLLAALNAERHMAWKLANDTSARYRHFLRESAEAVWRIDLAEPMPTSLPLDAQARWIEQHAVLAEHNDAYRRSLAPWHERLVDRPWREQGLWCEALVVNLQRAVARGYRLEGMEIDMERVDGTPSCWRASLSAHVENGQVTHFWGIAQDITEIKMHEITSATSQARVRTLVERLELFEHDARQSFAAELHDGPTQTLAAAEMLLASLRRSVPDDRRNVFEQVRSAIAQALGELRGLMDDAWPRKLESNDLGQALRQLVEGFREHERLAVNFAIVGRLHDLPQVHANLIYGALRELLRNVVKHAASARCTAALFKTAGALELRVRDYDDGDDGTLRDDFSGGFGLMSLTERARALGGSLELSTRENGTLVTMWLPLADAAHGLDTLAEPPQQSRSASR